MALENLKSTPLSNADATPKVINNARVMRMPSWEAVGTCEVAASSNVGPPASTYRLCRVPSNARISQVLAWADASGNAGQLKWKLDDISQGHAGKCFFQRFFIDDNVSSGGGYPGPRDGTLSLSGRVLRQCCHIRPSPSQIECEHRWS